MGAPHITVVGPPGSALMKPWETEGQLQSPRRGFLEPPKWMSLHLEVVKGALPQLELMNGDCCQSLSLGKLPQA